MKNEEIKKMLEGLDPLPWSWIDAGEKETEFIAAAPQIISQLLKKDEVMKEALEFYKKTYECLEGQIVDAALLEFINGCTSRAHEALVERERLEDC